MISLSTNHVREGTLLLVREEVKGKKEHEIPLAQYMDAAGKEPLEEVNADIRKLLGKNVTDIATADNAQTESKEQTAAQLIEQLTTPKPDAGYRLLLPLRVTIRDQR